MRYHYISAITLTTYSREDIAWTSTWNVCNVEWHWAVDNLAYLILWKFRLSGTFVLSYQLLESIFQNTGPTTMVVLILSSKIPTFSIFSPRWKKLDIFEVDRTRQHHSQECQERCTHHQLLLVVNLTGYQISWVEVNRVSAWWLTETFPYLDNMNQISGH